MLNETKDRPPFPCHPVRDAGFQILIPLNKRGVGCFPLVVLDAAQDSKPLSP